MFVADMLTSLPVTMEVVNHILIKWRGHELVDWFRGQSWVSTESGLGVVGPVVPGVARLNQVVPSLLSSRQSAMNGHWLVACNGQLR